MQGQKTDGRQVGKPNKVTAIFKDAVRAAYEDIGGNTAFTEWAKENPAEFYRIAARLIPTEMVSQSTNLNVIINRFLSQIEDTLLPTTQGIEHA
jgi:hypothetical protein